MNELEDRLDKLYADFSDDSTRCVELQEEIKHLETEVAQQTTLKNTAGLKVSLLPQNSSGQLCFEMFPCPPLPAMRRVTFYLLI